MKKQLTVALGLAVLATPAFASKARLQALGEDVNGSFYVNDLRNVFLNAANVNNYKDSNSLGVINAAIYYLTHELPTKLDQTADTDLLNIRDEMLAVLNQTKYLLRLS